MVPVFVHNLPLRPLSRVASDYFSDSVVCIEILRPLRPLREIKIIAFCIRAKTAKSAEIYSLSYFTLALEWSQTSLRQECAESLSTLYAPNPRTPPQPSPVWEGVVTTVSTAPANCPPETGWTRSEATEGVDDTNGLAELDERRRIKVKTIHPLPPAGYSPLSQGESQLQLTNAHIKQ